MRTCSFANVSFTNVLSHLAYEKKKQKTGTTHVYSSFFSYDTERSNTYVYNTVFDLARWRNDLIGTLRDYVGEGNRNVKKAIGLVSKTTTLHKHHAFLYISLPSLYNYDVKWPNFTYFWGRKRQDDKLYHLCLNSVAAPSLQFQSKTPSFY